MITSNRQIRALGLTGELIFHAEEIGAGDVYALEIPGAPAGRVNIDRAGNIWLDHEYLAPHQYLPRLIPEKP